MNKTILRLAVPNIISNIAIPLLGMVHIAIAGRIGEESAIGAVAIGSSIFNMIYWNCGFIRMGTSGITAQAYGAKNFRECANILVRSVVVALSIALLLLIFQKPIGGLALRIMQGSDQVQVLAAEYFYARIWAVPAAISLFAIHGWFIGMQDSITPMIVSITSNVINLVSSLIFVFRFDMGIAGIAWGTVAAQYSGLIISWVFWVIYYRRLAKFANFRESLKLKPMLKFFDINKDIFLRTFCIVAVYTFFTSASSKFGDTVLATNTLLMQLFTLYSYMADGFGSAAEALSGRFVGAKDNALLKRAIKLLFWWSIGISVGFTLTYLFAWPQILSLFSPTSAILETAKDYIIWIVIIPLAGSIPFLIDGIMLGSTQTKILRDTMFISIAIYFGIYYASVGLLGNNALWLAFVVFIAVRGLLQLLFTKGLNTDRLIKGYK